MNPFTNSPLASVDIETGLVQTQNRLNYRLKTIARVQKRDKETLTRTIQGLQHGTYTRSRQRLL